MSFTVLHRTLLHGKFAVIVLVVGIRTNQHFSFIVLSKHRQRFPKGFVDVGVVLCRGQDVTLDEALSREYGFLLNNAGLVATDQRLLVQTNLSNRTPDCGTFHTQDACGCGYVSTLLTELSGYCFSS